MTRSREVAFLAVRALLFATALVLLMRAAGARGDRTFTIPLDTVSGERLR